MGGAATPEEEMEKEKTFYKEVEEKALKTLKEGPSPPRRQSSRSRFESGLDEKTEEAIPEEEEEKEKAFYKEVEQKAVKPLKDVEATPEEEEEKEQAYLKKLEKKALTKELANRGLKPLNEETATPEENVNKEQAYFEE